MIILGIETSCDETGVAIYDTESNLMVHKLHSQVGLHAKFGGVVPELASRDHICNILGLVKNVFEEAGIVPQNLDAIAYTAGPGLAGALLVGASFAESLGFSLKIPTIPINHMEAHLLAPLLESNPPDFPFIALLVSGGHTQLIKAVGLGNYQILGETMDDAAGEAFDKVAKVLELPYPGGPSLERLAANGKAGRFSFPRPMLKKVGLNFSFSGLKTSTITCIRAVVCDEQTRADIACAFQEAVIGAIVVKCRRAFQKTGLKRLVVAGGVSANKELRRCLTNMSKEEDAEVYYPRLEFCTDNGAMIAHVGAKHILAGYVTNKKSIPKKIKVYPRWQLGVDPD